MSAECEFARLRVSDRAERPMAGSKPGAGEEESKAADVQSAPKCPVPHSDRGGAAGEEVPSEPAKCPYGYDAASFKTGPLSCVVCRALLYDSSRCVPCQHIFCRGCISRFQDCVICGADIERVEADPQLQELVERFIQGHGRIKRPALQTSEPSSPVSETKSSNVISYEDVSLARGSFLIQHAMRAFQAQNFDSAKSRLLLCAEDTREELSRSGATTETRSQLGGVLGLLGDCCRSMGDADASMMYFKESVALLSDLPQKDEEVVHALSVSLNKLGDLKYYGQHLHGALDFYSQALELRQSATDLTKFSSQVLDVAVSLAKVADVNRSLGRNGPATEGFRQAVKLLEGLSSGNNPKETSHLEPRRLSVLEFLHKQLEDESG